MLARPAANDPTNISPTCPNVSAAKRVCSCSVNSHQLLCTVCKSRGGVDQRHAALARCLADLVTKVNTEQTITGLPREPQHNPKIHAWTPCSTCARQHVPHRHGNGHAVFFQRRTHLSSQRPPRLHGQTRREEKVRQVPSHQLGSIHPCDQQTTWLPRTKVHQIPIQRYGPPCTTVSPMGFFSSPLHTRSTIVAVLSVVPLTFLCFSLAAPIAAIATELLLQRPPGDCKRSQWRPASAQPRCLVVLAQQDFSRHQVAAQREGWRHSASRFLEARTGGAASSSLLSQSWLCRFVLLAHSSLHALHRVGGWKTTGRTIRAVNPCRGARSAQRTRTCTALTAASVKHQSLRWLRVYHFSSHSSIPFMRIVRQKERRLAQAGHGILQTSPTGDEALALLVSPSQTPQGSPSAWIMLWAWT